MITTRDALILAVTKLKTRRIRLIITLIVSGLLFIVLASVSIIMNGAISSVESFSEEGLGKRYIVKVDQVNPDITFQLANDKELIVAAKSRFEQLKKDKSAEAKRLGIQYDASTEQSPIQLGGPNGEDTVDTQSTIIKDLIDAKALSASQKFYEQIAIDAKHYQATIRHNSVNYSSSFGQFNNFQFSTILRGKESLSDDQNSNPLARGYESIKSGITFISDSVLKSFLIKPGEIPVTGDAVPIIAPYTAAEQILGLSPLSASASAQDKITRIKEIRDKATGFNFDICLRNQVSVDKQQFAKQTQAEILQNKDKKDYRKPDVITESQASPCLDVATTRDVRTTFQKSQDTKQIEFESKFGKSSVASQRLVHLQIVGITPDPPSFGGFDISSILSMLLNSTIGNGWYIPISEQNAFPELKSELDKIGKVANFQVSTYMEFNSADAARTFVDQKSCKFEKYFNQDPAPLCIRDNTPYITSPFGSSSIALEQFRSGFNKFFTTAIMVVAVFSALIMMGTVGKIIADSRRETAVFRAMGAKRFDIVQLYLTYVTLIGIIISIMTIMFGTLIASFVQGRYQDDLTLNAVVSFNAQDLTRQFGLIHYDVKQLGMMVLIILLGSLVSAIIPLATNLRRNPIKDMRDER